MTSQPRLSIIIPVGPTETAFGGLADDLVQALSAQASDSVEIIVVSCDGGQPLTDAPLIKERLQHYDLQTISSRAGRAVQMNTGASQAAGEFLWFLHLDSRFSAAAFRALLDALAQRPAALHYFKLGFSQPCPGYMKLNAGGANLRSRLLGVPFGDQGFCLSRALFKRLGGFPENATYGEDHLLVWRLRRVGYRLNCLPETLWTSPRKYQQQGWLKLTCTYQWLWIKQAVGESSRTFLRWLLSEPK